MRTVLINSGNGQLIHIGKAIDYSKEWGKTKLLLGISDITSPDSIIHAIIDNKAKVDEIINMLNAYKEELEA